MEDIIGKLADIEATANSMLASALQARESLPSAIASETAEIKKRIADDTAKQIAEYKRACAEDEASETERMRSEAKREAGELNGAFRRNVGSWADGAARRVIEGR